MLEMSLCGVFAGPVSECESWQTHSIAVICTYIGVGKVPFVKEVTKCALFFLNCMYNFMGKSPSKGKTS